MVRTCPHCGSSDIDDDQARGDSTCMNCGTVLEESTIVSDVTYQERSGGGSALVGQFVSRDRAQPSTLSGVPGLLHQESREVTYMKGKKLIEAIASQLRINQHCIDTAFNFFKMCVSRNFTRGRIRSHVVAACLYMTCRLENTAHLLLDFSDVTQVNVFDLGRTLNFLARSLKINLPTTDPCLYILRFAVLLEFGDKEKEVVSLATRLVERMKRDWISTGRRPTGLCGAALVLASRCYNFNRTINDIVRVVHISETVVRKRLDEFGRTPSSELTIDEFTTIDLEQCEDPPAFQESRRKVREQLKHKEEEVIKEIEPEVMPLEEELEKALERKRREKFKKTSYAKMMSDSLVKEAPELRVADSVVRNEIVELAFDAGDERQRPLAGMSSCYAPTLESLGISDPLKPQPPTTAIHHNDYDENANGELDLEGIDDSEIDSYILSREEAEMKSRLWMKLNKDHLIEVERRQKERAEEEEREKESGIKRKRKKPSANVKKKEQIVAATAQEAMVKVIQEKKLSNKINYEILKEMEDSESNLGKEYYPTRDEILSSLTGEVSSDLNQTTTTNQSEDAVDDDDGDGDGDMSREQSCDQYTKVASSSSSTSAILSPSKKQSDANVGASSESSVSSLKRRPLTRSVRFKTALRSNRFRVNVHPTNETVFKQENSLIEENEIAQRTQTIGDSLVVAELKAESFSNAMKIKKEDSSDLLCVSPKMAQKQMTELVTSDSDDKRSTATMMNASEEDDKAVEVGKSMKVYKRRRRSREKQEQTVAAKSLGEGAVKADGGGDDIQMADSDHQRGVEVETTERSIEGSILSREPSSSASKNHFNELGGDSRTSTKTRYRALGRTKPNLTVAATHAHNNIGDDSNKNNNGDDNDASFDSQLGDESQEAIGPHSRAVNSSNNNKTSPIVVMNETNESSLTNVSSDASSQGSSINSCVNDQQYEEKIATRVTRATSKKQVGALQKRTVTTGRLRRKALVASTAEGGEERAAITRQDLSNASTSLAESSVVINDSASETSRTKMNRSVTAKAVKNSKQQYQHDEGDMEIDTTDTIDTTSRATSNDTKKVIEGNKKQKKSCDDKEIDTDDNIVDESECAANEIPTNTAQPSSMTTNSMMSSVNNSNTRSRYVKMKPNLGGARGLRENIRRRCRIESESSLEISSKVGAQVESSSSEDKLLPRHSSPLPSTSSSSISTVSIDALRSCDDALSSCNAIVCNNHKNNQLLNDTSSSVSSLTTITDAIEAIDLPLPPQVEKEYQRNFRLKKIHSSTQQPRSQDRRNRSATQKFDKFNSLESSASSQSLPTIQLTTTTNNDITVTPQTTPLKTAANSKSESKKRSAKEATLLCVENDDDGKANKNDVETYASSCSLLLCASKKRSRNTTGLNSSGSRRYSSDNVIGLEAMAALGRDCVAKPPNVHIVHGHFDSTPSTSSSVADLDIHQQQRTDNQSTSDNYQCLNTATTTSDIRTTTTTSTTTTTTSKSSGILLSSSSVAATTDSGSVQSLTFSSEPSTVSCTSTTAINNNQQSPVRRRVDSQSNSNTSESDVVPSPSSSATCVSQPQPSSSSSSLNNSETSLSSSTLNKAPVRSRYLKLKPNIATQKRNQNTSSIASTLRSPSNTNQK